MEAVAPDRRLADRYVLEELIATGGMAEVWRGRDEVLARRVAVKILRSDLAGDPDVAERFQREAIATAAFAGGKLTTTGSLLGTVRYISPEQVEGREVDARSDLYSAGAVMYETLTGRPPFEGPNDVATAMMRLTTDPLPPRAVRPGIPRGVESVVLRSM